MAAFRMKQRGMVMHEKLDKAAVSWRHLYCHLYRRHLSCRLPASLCLRLRMQQIICVYTQSACWWPLPVVQCWSGGGLAGVPVPTLAAAAARSLLPPQIEKLRLAAEMLPPDDGFQKAARLVEQAMQVHRPAGKVLVCGVPCLITSCCHLTTFPSFSSLTQRLPPMRTPAAVCALDPHRRLCHPLQVPEAACCLGVCCSLASIHSPNCCSLIRPP